MSENSWERRALAAEKTATVLKEQVRKLYDQGPQTPIHRQLERARQRDIENQHKRAVAEARTAELQRYSASLEATVLERTRAIRTILDNVTFGFLIADADGRVQEGFTRSCADLLGRPVSAGDLLSDLLGITGTRPAVDLQLGISQVFEDFLPEEVTLDQLPSRFPIGERVLHADGRVVRDDAGGVSGILYTLSDVTALEEARREARHNAMLLGILRQRSAFVAFVQDTRAQLDAAEESIGDRVFVRRAVHTIKGNAGCYQLDDLVERIHHIETDPVIEPAHIAEIRAWLDTFLTTHAPILGVDAGATSSVVEVSPDDVAALRAMLNPVDPDGIRRWSNEIVMRPVSELVGPLRAFVHRLGERLGREVDFQVEGADTPVDPTIVQPVVSTITHLLRNSVDHGLEAPEERGDKGEVGHVWLRFSVSEDGWRFEVEDDGRGVDFDRLVRKAVAAGVIGAEAAARLDDDARMELLFVDGLSSRDEATDISGRGVGMSAVRAAVWQRGGDLRITSVPGQGTTAVLTVPLPEGLGMVA